jgi:WD40 repeat protein
MTSEPPPHDVFVKPEEDLVSAQDALLSEPPQTVDPVVTHMESSTMAVDDMRTLSLQEEIALAESFALDERDESLAPEPFPAAEPGPPNGEADPDALRFESTGKYECRLILSGHTLSISALKFSPDGTMLASSGPCPPPVPRSLRMLTRTPRSKPRTRP